MCSSARSVLSPTGKHLHSWRTATGAVWAPAGLARLEGTPGQGFALPASGRPRPRPAPRTKVSRTAPPKCARVGPGMLGVGAQGSPARSPPSPHRWVNPKAPQATCLHTKRSVALHRDGRQQPVSFSRHPGQLPASPGVDPAPHVVFMATRGPGGTQGRCVLRHRCKCSHQSLLLFPEGPPRARASLLSVGLNPDRRGCRDRPPAAPVTPSPLHSHWLLLPHRRSDA